MWPSSCLCRASMELIKGRKEKPRNSRNEEMFRYPTTEELWEVPYTEGCEYEEREGQTIVRKRPDLPVAS